MRFLCQRDKYPRCHHQTLKLLISELPTFFPVLIRICDLEESEFLPPDVSRVVLALIRIRLSTFADSEQRFSDDYIPYDGGEDCTQFYPNHPIHTWPKLYNVGSSTDKDSCDKNFSSHSQFVDGIFSIGCACKYSITYGFELMLHSESPRHFFSLFNFKGAQKDIILTSTSLINVRTRKTESSFTQHCQN